jgi:hypothetical protein
MQIQTTMRYYFIPTRMPIISKTIKNVDKNVKNWLGLVVQA